MKFSRGFQEALERDAYPQEWVESAISYKKLKKCIKRVQEELLSLGLDHSTLQHLWQQGSLSAPMQSGPHNQDRALQYNLLNEDNTTFTPKLTIALDPKDGSPMDAWLSPDTRRFLRQYGRRQSGVVSGLENLRISEVTASDDSQLPTSSEQSETTTNSETNDEDETVQTIEIPLTSDSEFFQLLRRELANLERLQKNEHKHLEQQIVKLGDSLRQLQNSSKRRSKEEIELWREIFRLYNESEVFFSSHEQDAGERDVTHAQQQLTLFNKALAQERTKNLKLGPEASASLEQFLRINVDLLKMMKYQEINKVALTKIMKKFDKRTALHAREGVLVQLNKTPFIAQDLAKAACFTISDQVLKIIPQLDDYLCPICFSISWRPIKLRCGHVFCIRCLVVMQRAEQDNCPLCREHVVMEASSENIDQELTKFLKKNFKLEVKEKQRANEIAAGVDAFGDQYNGTHRCSVM